MLKKSAIVLSLLLVSITLTACEKSQEVKSESDLSYIFSNDGEHILDEKAQLSDLLSVDISQYKNKNDISNAIFEKLNIGRAGKILNKNNIECHYCDDFFIYATIEDYTMENDIATITVYEASSPGRELKFVVGNMSKEAAYNYFVYDGTIDITFVNGDLIDHNIKNIIALQVRTANDILYVPIIVQTWRYYKYEWIPEAVEYISELK